MKFVIDAMGSDNGAKAIVAGIELFLKDHQDVELIVAGKKDELASLENRVKIVDARDVVPMECGVLEVLRRKESSMYKAVEAVLENNADAVISAGSTGAFLSLSTLKIKKIEGVLRPALITPFPTKIPGKYCVLLDVGASSENKPEELAEFATLGAAYVKSVYGNNNPKIALISNGTEEGKGTELSKKTYALLKDKPGFCGYIEGRNVLEGDVDVIVFDGFTGNVFLKTAEGVAKLMSGMIKKAFKKNAMTKIGYLFAKSGFKELKETMDYKKVGGALLLGVNVVCVKAHGNSDADSFYHSLLIAYKLVQNKTVETIKENLKNEGNF